MLQLPCMLVCSFVCANRTRDRGCSKHPVFPAPSKQLRANEMPTSGNHVARTRNYIRVIASAAKQSIERRNRRNGLLRCARNDVDRPRRIARTRGDMPTLVALAPQRLQAFEREALRIADTGQIELADKGDGRVAV